MTPSSTADSCDHTDSPYRRPISELRDLFGFPRKDIYILGSGPSLDYFPKDFFDRGSGKITIGCNYVYKSFGVDFTVAKELPDADIAESASMGSIPVLSKFPFGNLNYQPRVHNVPYRHYVFDHKANGHTYVDWSVLGTDSLVVSYSTVTSAIHLAAYLGARNIFLCGCDAGTLDGKLHFQDYHGAVPDEQERTDWYRKFLRDMRGQTVALRDKLKSVYGCDVMTLSPFVNMGHEGHEFEF